MDGIYKIYKYFKMDKFSERDINLFGKFSKLFDFVRNVFTI